MSGIKGKLGSPRPLICGEPEPPPQEVISVNQRHVPRLRISISFGSFKVVIDLEDP
jgi:hypothetical protein